MLLIWKYYKEISKDSFFFFCLFLQLKYKEESKKELSTNLYSTLPETEEMKFAKAVMELQSEVGRAVGGDIAAGGGFRSDMLLVVWAL